MCICRVVYLSKTGIPDHRPEFLEVRNTYPISGVNYVLIYLMIPVPISMMRTINIPNYICFSPGLDGGEEGGDEESGGDHQ